MSVDMARQHASHEHFVVKVDSATDRHTLESRAAAIGTLEDHDVPRR
jgi:hypothetical protein